MPGGGQLYRLVPVQSPLMCAAIYAKKYEKITDRLAFISPCIAKKDEIMDENNKGYVSYNITFDHLMDYVRKNNIKGEPVGDEIEYGLGSIYPMPGGKGIPMSFWKTIKSGCLERKNCRLWWMP